MITVQGFHGGRNHKTCASMALQSVGHGEERALRPLETCSVSAHFDPTLKINICCLAILLSSLRKKRQGEKGKEEESQKGLNQRPWLTITKEKEEKGRVSPKESWARKGDPDPVPG